MLPTLSQPRVAINGPSSEWCCSLVCLGKKERLGRCRMQRPGSGTSAHNFYGYVVTPNGLRSAAPTRRREYRAAIRAVQLEESPRCAGLRSRLQHELHSRRVSGARASQGSRTHHCGKVRNLPELRRRTISCRPLRLAHAGTLLVAVGCPLRIHTRCLSVPK